MSMSATFFITPALFDKLVPASAHEDKVFCLTKTDLIHSPDETNVLYINDVDGNHITLHRNTAKR